MEIFGIEISEFLFSIFLPFVFFYLVLFIFLKRSNIFGNIGNAYYSITALTISLISVFSLYSIGLTKVLPYLAASITVLAFVAVYLFGVFNYSANVATREERMRKLREEIEKLTTDYDIERDERKREQIKRNLKERLFEAESLAKQIGIKIEEADWYKKAKSRV